MSMFAICGKVKNRQETSIVGQKGTKKAVVTIKEEINDGFRTSENIVQVTFIGKVCDSIPNFDLTGTLVSVYGKIESHEYNGKSYFDLMGTQIQLLDGPTEKPTQTPNQMAMEAQKPAQQQQMTQGSITEGVQLQDDDLPF